MDENPCPVGRTVHVLAIPTKPAAGVLVAGEGAVQMHVQKIQDNHHEWQSTVIDDDCPEYKVFVIRMCKWCNQTVKIEIPT